MNYQFTGTLVSVTAPERKTDQFTVRTAIFEVKETINGYDYTNYIQVQMSNKNIDILDNFRIGQRVVVYFGLQGRMWQDKCFTNLNAFKADAVKEDFLQPQAQPQAQAQQQWGGQPQQPQAQPPANPNPWGAPVQQEQWQQQQAQQAPAPQPQQWGAPAQPEQPSNPWGQPQQPAQPGQDKPPF